MAIALMKYDLDNIDDKQDHLRALKATQLCISIWEIDQHLRALIKYDEKLTNEVETALQDVRDKLREILNSNHIDIEELIN